jgi:hypothetical protein
MTDIPRQTTAKTARLGCGAPDPRMSAEQAFLAVVYDRCKSSRA